MIPAGRMDLYQLTSLVPHYAAGMAEQKVVMAFFSRRLPKHVSTGEPARGYLLSCGLGRALDHLEQAGFSETDLEILRQHPVLGPALRGQPGLVKALLDWRFAGRAWAPREGTPLFAGMATSTDGKPIDIDGVRPAAYCPYLVVETDLLSAKLIETPLLSFFNHMTMVATKASQVVTAARSLGERAVLEFGTRRTHPAAAVDAALAAYIGGCAASSNVQAHIEHGVPISGTMDHFAIQSWEQDGVARHVTERAYFDAFHKAYPDRGILLVDTYDTFGANTGIRAAVAATHGGPWGIRIDSNLTLDNLVHARQLLDSLGAQHTKIFVSGGMDENSILELADAPVDGYGVGERIVTSPDAPVGVGAVGKLCEVDGSPSMKLSRGSGKATLPGRTQVWRTAAGDLVGLEGESHPGTPLLQPVWDASGRLPGPSVHEVRDYAWNRLQALSAEQRKPRKVTLPVSAALQGLLEDCVAQATR